MSNVGACCGVLPPRENPTLMQLTFFFIAIHNIISQNQIIGKPDLDEEPHLLQKCVNILKGAVQLQP